MFTSQHHNTKIITTQQHTPTRHQQDQTPHGKVMPSLTIDDNNDDDEVIVQSFVDAIPPENRKALISELQSFVVRHASHHRPIALVSSGGTAADLEIHSVRCLDNFSTGKRGAISVEELLKRGYAVIHLWRRGSASPYGRVLSQAIMGPSSTPNQGISIGSLGKLFATGDQEEDQDDQLVQDVLDAQNSNGNDNANTPNNKRSNNNNSNTTKKSSSLFKGGIHLHRRIINSTPLRTALIERQSALEEGRIMTIPFRSVEEYLAKLQLSSESLRDSQALAMFFLCGAVSDFYVPLAERSTHKIQSRDVSHQDSYNNQMLSKEKESNCLNLKLWPVPKVMGLLRRKWAPDAFVCSFKLETDMALLRRKAEGAVEKYGCHMVVGNLLKTRYDQVYILAPADMETLMHNGTTSDNIDKTSNDHKINSDGKNYNWKVQDWPMNEISRPKASEPDALEVMIMENVVQMHFEYISTSISGSLDKSGTESVLRAHIEIEQKKRNIEKELFWNQVQSVVLEWGGILAGAALSVAISTALRRRINV